MVVSSFDQQRLCTIIEIDESDCFTTNSSSSCFTSPSLDSPPIFKRLQTLSLTPRNAYAYDLWRPGAHSSFDSSDSAMLTRKLTLNSDSGRESVDSSLSGGENEHISPNNRYTANSSTIYQIEKARERFPCLSKQKMKSSPSFTSTAKVFISENFIKPEDKQEPSTTVLKIYVPPVIIVVWLF